MVSRIAHLKLTVNEDISISSLYSYMEDYVSSFQFYKKDHTLVSTSIQKRVYTSFNTKDWNIFNFVQGDWS